MKRLIIVVLIMVISTLLVLAYIDLTSSTPVLGASSQAKQRNTSQTVKDFSLTYPSTWTVEEGREFNANSVIFKNENSYVKVHYQQSTPIEIQNSLECENCNKKIINNITFIEATLADTQVYETAVGTTAYRFIIPVSDTESRAVFETIDKANGN